MQLKSAVTVNKPSMQNAEKQLGEMVLIPVGLAVVCGLQSVVYYIRVCGTLSRVGLSGLLPLIPTSCNLTDNVELIHSKKNADVSQLNPERVRGNGLGSLSRVLIVTRERAEFESRRRQW
ncbi:hypothetical protein CBL_03507 [Carabus blaptoides fortunei]